MASRYPTDIPYVHANGRPPDSFHVLLCTRFTLKRSRCQRKHARAFATSVLTAIQLRPLARQLRTFGTPGQDDLAASNGNVCCFHECVIRDHLAGKGRKKLSLRAFSSEKKITHSCNSSTLKKINRIGFIFSCATET